MLPERSSTITISSGISSASELVAAHAASSPEPPSRVTRRPPSPVDVVAPAPPAPPWPEEAAVAGSSTNSLGCAFAVQPQTAADQTAVRTSGERIYSERETIEHLGVW